TIISVKPTSRSTLTWSSKNNATSCYPSAGEGVGFTTGGATSGTFSVKPASTSVYEIKCTGPGGDSLAQTTVTVINPSATISSTRSRVLSGSAVTLTWSSSQVTSCAVSGPGLSSATQSGSQSVTISSQSTYTITCQTVDTPVSSSVTVNVAPSFQEF
ncbi:MAG: hypothetical protein NTV60_00780, partial [Candidatus Kaiserbacteria bacterium]|nr:hypothetical protein [Candidatus Kaiserbacteria bacterium]